MATSPLDPSNLSGRKDRSIGRGHGTRALGPSDSSDSGSDLVGAPGLASQVDGFGLDRGNTNESEESFAGNTAGPDVGDANLDSDSDRAGTGETAAAFTSTTLLISGLEYRPDIGRQYRAGRFAGTRA